MDKIRILQLGEEDWKERYILPGHVQLDYVKELKELPEKPYDMVFLDRDPSEEETGLLYRAVRAYTMFVTDRVDRRGRSKWLCLSRGAQYIAADDIQRFLTEESRYYFPRPYGENDRDTSVRIRLVFTLFVPGSVSDILEQRVFEEEDLEQVIRFESSKGDGTLFVSVQAKGSGRLWLTALHRRISRGSHGCFLPGGERYVTSRREEAFCYFEPGDLKPPLNVYFSGYKTLQGFEGYYMMKNLGCPFLLLAEPRLEGGSFYMGSEEYEQIYPNVIREYMQVLGFTQEQVIMSGLSMGTFGALYYGCDIEPYAMVVGKPLVSIGNVAANEKYLRPGGFPTSLDVLHFQCGGMGEEDIRRLNEKFWNKFDRADWRKSRFAVAYMIEDDYDADAYETLLLHLNSGGVQAYGKGLHGRHNDNTPGIVDWFAGQYKKILQEDFGRRMDR